MTTSSNPVTGTAVLGKLNQGMHSRELGFTLIELMIVIMLLGFMAVLAIPNLRNTVLNARITGSTNEFVTALKLARSEALKRHAVVRVCAASGVGIKQTPTAADCSASENLSAGYMIVAENIDEDPDPEFEPIRVGSLGNKNFLKAENGGSGGYLFAFNAKGELIGNTVNMTLCDERDDPEKYGRSIRVTTSGVIRAQKINEGDSCF